MKYLFVYNPFSRKGLSIKEINHIKERFQTDQVSFFKTQGQGSITEYVSKVGSDFDFIISVGGDGTLHETVCGILKLEKRPKVGILPRGTMNDVSKDLGYYSNLDKSIDIIKKGNTCLKHVYSINDTYFLYGLAIGRYACVSYNTKNKRQFGKLSYYFSCLKEYFKSKPTTIVINNQKLKISQLFILNTAYLAGYKMNKDNDMHIHVKYILSKNRFIDTIHFYRFLKSRGKKCVEEMIVDSIEIDSKDLAYTLDGEKYISSKAYISLLYNHIEVICK